MVNYDYYEELEEQAYNDKIRRKKKPKKQKKSYKKEDIQNVKRDKKNSWSHHSKAHLVYLLDARMCPMK